MALPSAGSFMHVITYDDKSAEQYIVGLVLHARVAGSNPHRRCVFSF